MSETVEGVRYRSTRDMTRMVERRGRGPLGTRSTVEFAVMVLCVVIGVVVVVVGAVHANLAVTVIGAIVGGAGLAVLAARSPWPPERPKPTPLFVPIGPAPAPGTTGLFLPLARGAYPLVQLVFSVAMAAMLVYMIGLFLFGHPAATAPGGDGPGRFAFKLLGLSLVVPLLLMRRRGVAAWLVRQRGRPGLHLGVDEIEIDDAASFSRREHVPRSAVAGIELPPFPIVGYASVGGVGLSPYYLQPNVCLTLTAPFTFQSARGVSFHGQPGGSTPPSPRPVQRLFVTLARHEDVAQLRAWVSGPLPAGRTPPPTAG